MKTHHILQIFAASSILLWTACSQAKKQDQTVSAESTTTPAVRGMVRLAETVSVAEEATLAGLWAGAFDSTANMKKFEKLLEASDEGYGDFGGISEEFIKKLPADMKKLVEKDPVYGDYYLVQPNKVSIVIDELSAGKIKARSICSGNYRNMTGTYTTTSTGWALTMTEPGDDPYDGTFTLTVNKNDSLMHGDWKPFKNTTSAKTITLCRKNFKYNPEAEWNYTSNKAQWKKEAKAKNDDDYASINLNASAKLLKVEDVENQPKGTLRIARNAIYARHGYSFKNRDVRNYFERYEDYIPLTVDVRNDLTEIEKKNEALIKRYEDYAKDFYDEYGR
jgi:hypothetical protein